MISLLKSEYLRVCKNWINDGYYVNYMKENVEIAVFGGLFICIALIIKR